MNQPKFKKSLYIPTLDNCMKLVSNVESFIYKVEKIDDVNIITFSYRHPSYSDFDRMYARNLRSISFNFETKECLVLSFHKFFNYDENPFTLPYYVNKWTPIRVSDKVDGSLILFFEVNGKLYAKTKFNSTSDQSVLAMKIVNENLDLKQEIHTVVKNGYTPMFELIHPDDPHVISYDKKHLYYLMSRNKDNGEYYFHDNLAKYDTVEVFDHKKENVVDNIVNGLSDVSIKDKEGFVVYFSNGEIVKFKYAQYISRHNVESITCYTYELVAKMFFEETLDDVIAYASDGLKTEIESKLSVIKSKYNEYKFKLNCIYNEIINNVQDKSSRKEFALIAKKYDDIYFNLLMQQYTGKLDENKVISSFIKLKLWEVKE